MMSGHKTATISISQDEYRRLYELEKGIQFHQNVSSTSAPQMDLSGLQNEILTDLTYRQEQYLNLLGDLEMNWAETYQESIGRQQQADQDMIHELISLGGVQQYDREAFHTRIAQVERELAERYEDLTDRISPIETFTAELLAKNIHTDEAARETAAAVEQLRDYIFQNFPRHLIDVQSIDQAVRRAITGGQNLNSGRYEAALSQFQSAWLDLEEIKISLDADYRRWSLLWGEVMIQLNRLSAKIDEYAYFQPIDFNGQLLSEVVPLADWSLGDFDLICQDFNKLVDQVEYEQENLTKDQISQLSDVEIPQIEKRLSDCLTNARMDLLNAQQRYELANRILAGLVVQGYIPQDGTFLGNNYKAGYSASAVAADGSEVKIFIEPMLDMSFRNRLHIISEDKAQKTEHEMAFRANEIRESINRGAIHVSHLRKSRERLANVQVENTGWGNPE